MPALSSERLLKQASSFSHQLTIVRFTKCGLNIISRLCGYRRVILGTDSYWVNIAFPFQCKLQERDSEREKLRREVQHLNGLLSSMHIQNNRLSVSDSEVITLK